MLSPLSSILALALATGAHALSDTSPFLLLSSEPLHQPAIHSTQFSTAPHVQQAVLDTLSTCKAQLYVVVTHPGLNGADFADTEAMPAMRSRVLKSVGSYHDVVQIPEVVGDIDVEAIVSGLEGSCGVQRISLDSNHDSISAHETTPLVVTIELKSWLSDENKRQKDLKAADAQIEAYLRPITNHTRHVLVYISSPRQSSNGGAELLPTYEMDESLLKEIMHMDLKRAIDSRPQTVRAASEHQQGLPLFERYQFLSPAIFMGLTVTLLLLVILYVGVSAIAGLEVSYMAFSKEMGPAAQNKNKQQ